MDLSIGVVFAFGALIFWGFGDFLIQRSTRRIGDWEILFFIALFGTIVLTPFVLKDIVRDLSSLESLFILLLTSVVIFFAALIDLEALKTGKIAVVEPVYSIEIPVVLILSIVFINETLTSLQMFLLLVIIVGLILVSLKSDFMNYKSLEKGVFLAAVSAILIGASDFLVGLGARVTNPLMINWFLSLNLLVYTFLYLLFTGRLGKLVKDVKKSPKLIFMTCLLDNIAWISYAFAAFLIPITIAVAISENYIAVAALLGLYISKEKILTHQKVGLVVSLIGAVALALLI